MYYHASRTGDIKNLEPRISNHGIPLVYFSTKPENTLVYLSNAVEKFCKETGFCYDGTWEKWATYGFDNHGTLILEEYYPNAIYDTYKGVDGYIYIADDVPCLKILADIPDAVTTSECVTVRDCIYVPDAYDALLDAAAKGQLVLNIYEKHHLEKLEWIRRTIRQEYASCHNHPEYKYFLKAHFEFL